MQFQAASRNTKLSVYGLILSSAMMLFLQLPVHASQDVTLAWNPSSTPDIAGYKIYYGTACGCYSNVLEVGNTTNATVSGLVPGIKYFFAATTVDSTGNESGFSNEAIYAVPMAAAVLAPTASPAGQFSFTVSGDTGQQYVVQASTNLLDWDSLQTNAAPFLFTDSDAAGFNQRFYRAFCLPP